jgi:predicted enzyme related to lactoylglutathione lyase
MFQNTKAFFSFSVDDLAQAKQFYADTLGVSIEETAEGVRLDLPGCQGFLYPKDDHQPATYTILNFPVESVEETVKELKSRGVDFEVYDEGELKTDANGSARDTGGPVAIAWFRDPAGNFLSVVESK